MNLCKEGGEEHYDEGWTLTFRRQAGVMALQSAFFQDLQNDQQVLFDFGGMIHMVSHKIQSAMALYSSDHIQDLMLDIGS